jgi:D-amino-acid oxidase
LVVVDNPGIEGFFIDDPGSLSDEPTYILSHGDHVVLGGSWAPYSERTTPDPDVGEAIIARCAAIEPALAKARVREHRVGLRPARHRVRLEREDHPSRAIIHNYGHGGSGLTLSWGCALDVVALLNQHQSVR